MTIQVFFALKDKAHTYHGDFVQISTKSTIANLHDQNRLSIFKNIITSQSELLDFWLGLPIRVICHCLLTLECDVYSQPFLTILFSISVANAISSKNHPIETFFLCNGTLW